LADTFGAGSLASQPPPYKYTLAASKWPLRNNFQRSAGSSRFILTKSRTKVGVKANTIRYIGTPALGF